MATIPFPTGEAKRRRWVMFYAMVACATIQFRFVLVSFRVFTELPPAQTKAIKKQLKKEMKKSKSLSNLPQKPSLQQSMPGAAHEAQGWRWAVCSCW